MQSDFPMYECFPYVISCCVQWKQYQVSFNTFYVFEINFMNPYIPTASVNARVIKLNSCFFFIQKNIYMVSQFRDSCEIDLTSAYKAPVE